MTRIFQLVVLGYVGIQVYAVSKAYTGLAMAPSAIPALAILVLAMTFMPVLLWRIERGGRHYTAEVVAWVAYGWMGFVFLFFWIALVLEIASFATGVASTMSSIDPTSFARALRSFPVAVGVTLAVAAYGIIDARRPRIERVVLRSSKLSPGSTPFRIALISDVHLGVLVGARRLQRMIDRVQRLDADVVLSAGDLVDGQADRVSLMVPLLDALRPRYGKFAVTGNHDYYVGIEHALDFHARAGFRVLSGTSVDIGDAISIAGVDDPTARRMGQSGKLDDRAALDGAARERFTILLKHQPVVDARALGLFDLQLSGHVHQGQIFPFGWLVRLAYPVRTGLTRLEHRAWIYVSRGTGTWGPPMRVGASPEITLIEIAPA